MNKMLHHKLHPLKNLPREEYSPERENYLRRQAMAKKLSIIIICVLASTVFVKISHSADEAGLVVLESFIEEVGAIDEAIVKAEAVQVKLKEKEKELVASAELLKTFGKNAGKKYREVKKKLTVNARKIEAQVAECSDSYDRSKVNECNNRAEVLNANHARLLEDRDIAIENIKFLEERRKVLNQDVIDWAKQVKKNNYNLNELRVKERDLVGRLNSSLDNPGLGYLKQRARASKDCAGITNLETAHHCLQKIWDGAAD
jgi:hypothetical protein